ncbi:hypothetical protein PoB_006002600 [Plakobranchus ocellatus]|uniref:Uncharacterized protein n=1 Tax=Plakobranchus ocellatus TaxID=259542 RepID=A0AAV4CNS4_9GAST|nr:hypothetical protein PoB_006002600 [Plakobranchus ocellatus]
MSIPETTEILTFAFAWRHFPLTCSHSPMSRHDPMLFASVSVLQSVCAVPSPGVIRSLTLPRLLSFLAAEAWNAGLWLLPQCYMYTVVTNFPARYIRLSSKVTRAPLKLNGFEDERNAEPFVGSRHKHRDTSATGVASSAYRIKVLK